MTENINWKSKSATNFNHKSLQLLDEGEEVKKHTDKLNVFQITQQILVRC